MKKNHQEKITYNTSLINESVLVNIEKILTHFKVNYYLRGNKISAACPIHGGDNYSAFCILTEGVGNWMCYTHRCHEKYGNSNGASLIKLVQALLNTNSKKQYTFSDTVRWIKDFTNISDEELVQSQVDLLHSDFISLTKHLSYKDTKANEFIPKELIAGRLKIPSDYFLGRGFLASTLEHFSVGDCLDSTRAMYERSVVPFFDDTGKYVVGCSGRSMFEKCSTCSTYHNPKTRCPINGQEKSLFSKWKHSGGFNAENYLYNLNNAKEYLKSKTIVLVESPGNVWRLFEAGILNAVATLGTKFTDSQKGILECLGIENIILARDSGEPGRIMSEMVKDKCYRIFNYNVVETPYDDIGETPIEVVQDLFKGYI